MKFYDRIYGEEEINEPILLDLIDSKEIQRLKTVSQYGLPEDYSFKKGFTRYEHSLGVLILLRRLGAKLDEQIAGLLHDVNHTAFSHVVDWVFGDPVTENHQDKNFFGFLESSNIPKILEKYSFDLNNLFDLEKFSLLEKNAPSLCADRIDYSLRELSFDGEKELAKSLFENLFNLDGQIVFKTEFAGKTFFDKYFYLNKFSWGGEDARSRYIILANILKKAINNNLLFKDDLYKSEKEIIDILLSSNETYILQNLNLLKEGFTLLVSDEGFELKTKFRHVNPEILFMDNYKKLSELSEECRCLIDFEKNESSKFKKVKILSKDFEFVFEEAK